MSNNFLVWDQPNPKWYKIVEADASDLGYGSILKQRVPYSQKEELLRFTLGIWKNAQKKLFNN